MKNYLLFLLLSIPIFVFGQDSIPYHKANTYRSQNNPYYWKNRMPYPGYWQQDVYYNIKAKIDEQNDVIEGDETLTYYNNSPDSLPFVYFHLYQNAFLPGSYMHDLFLKNNGISRFGKYESLGLASLVESIRVENTPLKMSLDNTILKVFLEKPLQSGDSITFSIKFKTFYDSGEMRRRMKIFEVDGNKHYDGVHWYPRISAYDHKFGWDTDQHLGKEFYGDFGTYDVSLDFASHYVLDATGELLNEKEVLPDSLRKKLDIKNFVDKPMNSKASEILKPDGKRKTWIFHAENVHDFAFTADPTYRIGEAQWNGIRCIALAQETHAGGWQNAAEYTAKIIKTFSTDIGMYTYPKMIVADARDGMEYPMLTLDGGYDPNYRYLFSHEVGHNWFMGMVGSNETYRAYMDEGFTQFLTVWAINRIEGLYEAKEKIASPYIRKYFKQPTARYAIAYSSYLADAIKNPDAIPINTHSDMFAGALKHGGGYRQVYMKTATMLYNLQYVLGDTLFLKAMQHYFDKWKICHPYPEDFRNAIINYTHVDLNWFFDQWLETSKNIDYKVKGFHKTKEKDHYQIVFKRKGEMQMPIEFQVFSKEGKEYNFYIPNTWFEKKTDAKILPRWIGWGLLKDEYTAEVEIPGGIHYVEIDPEKRMADVNLLNNNTEMPLKIVFDSRVMNYADWENYVLKWRPDIWYNEFDGIKAGLHFEGNYMNTKHVFSLTTWANTMGAQNKSLDQRKTGSPALFSYHFSYKTSTEKLMRNSSLLLNARSLDGLNMYSISMFKYDESLKNKFYVELKSMYRPRQRDAYYLLYPGEWGISQYNNTITTGVQHKYPYHKGEGEIHLFLKSSTLYSDYSFAQLGMQVINTLSKGKLDFKTRVFMQYGSGSHLADESALYLASANPEQMMNNKFTRSRAFIDHTWLNYGEKPNHFQQGGGLNLRGYAGYLAPETNANGDVVFTYKSNTGASISVEMDFEKLFAIAPAMCKDWLKVETYLFGDAGVINYGHNKNIMLSGIRADAGIGTVLTIKKWGPLQAVDPFSIRFDMPLFLSSTAAVEPEFIKFRWIVGIGRSF